jgi:hypothetical protein
MQDHDLAMATQTAISAVGFVERDPPPFPAGRPLEWNLCPQGTPPDAFEFLGATPTEIAFVMPCPACPQGWAGLRPDGRPYGYEIALDIGCTRDCPAEEIAWWHAFQLGNLPPDKPDERVRRYAVATAQGALRDLAKAPADPERRARAFARTAYRVGQATALGRLDKREVARALIKVGLAIGLPVPDAVSIARRNTLAGAAAPMRGPR